MTAVERISALIRLSCSREVSMVRVRSLECSVKYLMRPSLFLTGCRMDRNQASWPLPRSRRNAPFRCSPRLIAPFMRW
ncbi:hypothetical protein D3C71_2089170 [compost metagenome]